MKVKFLVTGSGGSFYCTNCYRDMLYLKAVRATEGAVASAIPLYLPPEKRYIESGFDTNVFFGAISLYIREKVHALENMPSFFDKILDSPPLLKLASGMAGTTRSEGLEHLTLNMIDSSPGNKDVEVKRLVKYMISEGKPDVIHLSNALIIGLAGQIKRYMDVRIVCSLQNEDDWLNDMAEPFQSQAWKMIADESKYIDAFVCPSKYYRDFFIRMTGHSGNNIYIVPSGLEIPEKIPVKKEKTGRVIGFFSRVNYHNGFDKLVDAFIELKKSDEFSDLQLYVCGGSTGDDKPFIKEQINKIRTARLEKNIKIFPGFDGIIKEDFLSGIDILSVPVRKYDAFGLYILEANAAGIPVVQPETGSFPEIIETTGGGILYSPDTTEKLSETLAILLRDNKMRMNLGEQGRLGVLKSLTAASMGNGLVELYRKIL